jgi:FemAB-related protein (PEP-CTERM system-associated)
VNVRVCSSEHEAAWDEYVARHAEATVFHRAGWKRVIESSTGHAGRYWMAWDGDRVAGIYPLFILSTRLFGTMGVSLPFVGYGGIVSDGPDAEQALTGEAETLARAAGCDSIELRQRYPLKGDWPTSDRKVVTVISTAGGAEQVFARLHPNVRNKIRKAEKNGVSVQQGAECLPEFYDIYSRNLRDLGTPVISRRFFEAALETLPDNLKVYRAVRQGKTIAAKIVAVDRRTCFFTWSASLREELGHAPVHAMNWRAIVDACEAGCAWVDLGRSTAGTSHQDFKKYWGGESWTLPWAYQLLGGAELPGLHKEDRRFSLAIALWKRMPLGLSRLLGPPIARGLP